MGQWKKIPGRIYRPGLETGTILRQGLPASDTVHSEVCHTETQAVSLFSAKLQKQKKVDQGGFLQVHNKIFATTAERKYPASEQHVALSLKGWEKVRVVMTTFILVPFATGANFDLVVPFERSIHWMVLLRMRGKENCMLSLVAFFWEAINTLSLNSVFADSLVTDSKKMRKSRESQEEEKRERPNENERGKAHYAWKQTNAREGRERERERGRKTEKEKEREKKKEDREKEKERK